MPRILHLTDTHLVAPPGRVCGVLDTADLFQQSISAVKAALPRIGPIDAILVTGDVSDDGSIESYELFRSMVEPLGLPLLVIPGNHDRREEMRKAFADLCLFSDTGRLDWVRDLDGLRIVGIDTLVEGSGGGVIEDTTLAFLETALGKAGPTILAMHHPPFSSGIRFMDDIGLKDIGGLQDILRRATADIRILCGHLHLTATGSIGRFPAIVGPSTCSTFQIDFRPDAPEGFFTGGGGFMIHDWSEGFRSMTIPAAIGNGPFPF